MGLGMVHVLHVGVALWLGTVHMLHVWGALWLGTVHVLHVCVPFGWVRFNARYVWLAAALARADVARDDVTKLVLRPVGAAAFPMLYGIC